MNMEDPIVMRYVSPNVEEVDGEDVVTSYYAWDSNSDLGKLLDKLSDFMPADEAYRMLVEKFG
jgi:hypothetical protein